MPPEVPEISPVDLAPARAGARLSIAFFNHPNYDVRIECLAPAGAARHEPVLSGAYRDRQYRRIGLGPA